MHVVCRNRYAVECGKIFFDVGVPNRGSAISGTAFCFCVDLYTKSFQFRIESYSTFGCHICGGSGVLNFYAMMVYDPLLQG
ncbi:hypothetical protein Rmet_6555 [Cupriavidus metallidurans CH34]|uniref:Uncharacterized protein n=1 Tax=Cupriavidus metallidurans (strain ATCC 43123 / DSM 2839 / NBRC 102507 / CH34) TaxID=266264 RepID=D3DXZ1_CUPMC|nr:hypothetical protein Rmet_6555 [Cupriavidus metallidurans CH34]